MLGLSAGMESTVQHIRSKDFPQEDSHPHPDAVTSFSCFFCTIFLNHIFLPICKPPAPPRVYILPALILPVEGSEAPR